MQRCFTLSLILLLFLLQGGKKCAKAQNENILNICPPGYAYRGQKCQDVDECNTNTHNCGNKKCYNLPGSFVCEKELPAVVTCMKLVTVTPAAPRPTGAACSLERPCSSREECVKSDAGYFCACRQGYQQDPKTRVCVDINECLVSNICPDDKECYNANGTFVCVRRMPCGTGYVLNTDIIYGEQCEDIDECAMNPHICENILSRPYCMNTRGRFVCVPTPPSSTTINTPLL